LVHELLRLGNTIKLEKISDKAWQRLFGKSVGLRFPREFVSRLKCLAQSAGVTVIEFSTFKTKLSQTCHQCKGVKKKSLRTRVHKCECGVLCQRDLYSAFLARFVENDLLQVDLADIARSGAQALLLAARRQATEKTNLRLDGQVPSSFGSFPPVRAGRHKSFNSWYWDPPMLYLVIGRARERLKARREPPRMDGMGWLQCHVN
jgi:hypothetical protein